MRRLLSIAAPTDGSPAVAFELDREWRLHPQVAVRDESFGALAYHYGTRRLHFLKSPTLVELVTSLDQYDSAAEAMDAIVPAAERTRYSAALAGLADSGVINAV